MRQQSRGQQLRAVRQLRCLPVLAAHNGNGCARPSANATLDRRVAFPKTKASDRLRGSYGWHCDCWLRGRRAFKYYGLPLQAISRHQRASVGRINQVHQREAKEARTGHSKFMAAFQQLAAVDGYQQQGQNLEHVFFRRMPIRAFGGFQFFWVPGCAPVPAYVP